MTEGTNGSRLFAATDKRGKVDLRRQLQRILRGPSSEPGKPSGDCYRTAIACMLNVHADTVPHFYKDGELDARAAEEREDYIDEWLGDQGYARLLVEEPALIAAIPEYEVVLIGGDSPRGNRHVVLGRRPDAFGYTGVHDPHPNGGWLTAYDRVWRLADSEGNAPWYVTGQQC
jgi:hypothetical protein